MHRPLGTNVSISPVSWPGIHAYLDDKLRFTSSPPGTSISPGSTLLSARHKTLKSKDDLALVPVSTKRMWLRVTDPTSSKRRLSESSRETLAFFAHLSSRDWRPRPLRSPPTSSVESAADAFGKGNDCGVGGWLLLPSGRLLWFAHRYTVNDFLDLGLPMQPDANLDISSYETLAQCFVVLLAFWKAHGSGRLDLTLPALSDNSGAESDMSDQTKARARLLYGVLNGLLYDRGRRLLRSVVGQNGYESWRLLSRDLMPQSRNRVLALLRTISAWPAFDAKQGISQQLVRLETAFEEYERLVPGGVPENHKMATLLGCLSGQLRQHANVVITDDSSYRDLRELVLRWDGAQTRWSSSVALSYGLQESAKGLKQDTGGKHGKGKNDKGKQGKGKQWDKNGKGGKQGKWQQQGGWQQQQRDSWNNNKGKQGKGKQDKGKQDKGKHYSYDNYTGKGYGGNQWQDRRVQQVQDQTGQQQQQVQQPWQAPPQPSNATAVPSFSSAASQASTMSTAVRRVFAEPLVVDVSDLELPGDSCIRMLQCPEYRLDSSDNDDDWYRAPDQPALVLQASPPPAVRAVQYSSDATAQAVIIDSGADISCLPRCFASAGKYVPARNLRVQDAQGATMAVSEERLVDFIVESSNCGPVGIRERCIIADVTQPLISLGRLIKRGWFPCRGEQGFWLNHDGSGADVPLGFKGMSLLVQASIRRVSQPPPENEHNTSVALDLPPRHVRAMFTATLSEQAEKLQFGWQIGSTGHIIWRGKSSIMIDPSLVVVSGWPYRTTIMRRSDDEDWLVAETCVKWADLADIEGPIPGGGEAELIVVLHPKLEQLSDVGIQCSNEASASVEMQVEPPALHEDDEAGGIGDVLFDQEPGGAEADEVVPQDPEAAAVLPDMEEPEQLPPPPAIEDKLVLDGVELTAQSTIAALASACDRLGLRHSGSKRRLYERIKGYLQKQQLSLSADMTRDAVANASRTPSMQSIPTPPSRAEQLLHELTHEPYAAWCPSCIAMRALPDRSERTVDAPRDIPRVSFDFMYTGYDESQNEAVHKPVMEGDDPKDLLCCLVCHDQATSSIACVPCPGKSATRYLGVEVMRFVQSLGHPTVEIFCDNEPTTIRLQDAICVARSRLGLKTLKKNPPIGNHQSNGAVERTVDLVRRLACTLLDVVRRKTGCSITVKHPLFAWSFSHAAWIRNHFAVQGGLTPYERCYSTAYKGKLVPFGEPVFGQIVPKRKGNAKWLKAVFVGKTRSNDQYLIPHCKQVRHPNMPECAPHWP
ncbi:GIP [Symbiodinium sp. CCMP2592]|nr:GIP [Symbiodinium sp. CCMP2592]